jgi:hypothetical protein
LQEINKICKQTIGNQGNDSLSVLTHEIIAPSQAMANWLLFACPKLFTV